METKDGNYCELIIFERTPETEKMNTGIEFEKYSQKVFEKLC
jgi:hypothetical protein